MGSYVISISLGTGCYRHIQIAKTSTLFALHKAILQAFEFMDDHAHAFFMDNKYWSQADVYYSMKMNGNERLTKNYKLGKLGLTKGRQFKYIFDFGEEWRFQCKVLQESDIDVLSAYVRREVGQPPEQYPEPEYYDEEYDFPDILPQDTIQALYETLPLPMSTIKTIHL